MFYLLFQHQAHYPYRIPYGRFYRHMSRGSFCQTAVWCARREEEKTNREFSLCDFRQMFQSIKSNIYVYTSVFQN